MAKNKIKLTEEQLFGMLYSAYKDGDFDSRRETACLGHFQDNFKENYKALFEEKS